MGWTRRGAAASYPFMRIMARAMGAGSSLLCSWGQCPSVPPTPTCPQSKNQKGSLALGGQGLRAEPPKSPEIWPLASSSLKRSAWVMSFSLMLPGRETVRVGVASADTSNWSEFEDSSDQSPVLPVLPYNSNGLVNPLQREH